MSKDNDELTEALCVLTKEERAITHGIYRQEIDDCLPGLKKWLDENLPEVLDGITEDGGGSILHDTCAYKTITFNMDDTAKRWLTRLVMHALYEVLVKRASDADFLPRGRKISRTRKISRQTAWYTRWREALEDEAAKPVSKRDLKRRLDAVLEKAKEEGAAIRKDMGIKDVEE